MIKYPSAKPATAYSIPASVYIIKSAAVSDCLNLTTISIPATVYNIGRLAFSGCTNLRKIISYIPEVHNYIITMGDGIFSGVNKDLCRLYVPVGRIYSYEQAAQWQDFNYIYEIDAVTGITINPTNQTINICESLDLASTVTITPSNASNDIITWSSSNPAIALVDANGIVTGLSAGNATITATTAEGNFAATCNVEVIMPTDMRYITLTVANGEDIELVMDHKFEYI